MFSDLTNANLATEIRMPAIKDLKFLPDMGRMNGNLSLDDAIGLPPDQIAAPRIGPWHHRLSKLAVSTMSSRSLISRMFLSVWSRAKTRLIRSIKSCRGIGNGQAEAIDREMSCRSHHAYVFSAAGYQSAGGCSGQAGTVEVQDLRDRLGCLLRSMAQPASPSLSTHGETWGGGPNRRRQTPSVRSHLCRAWDRTSADQAEPPWTNGQVERMNQTIKDATVKRYYYASHDELRRHLQLFIDAYNHARRLKTLRGPTPYEFIIQQWTKEPKRFKTDPSNHTPGPNN